MNPTTPSQPSQTQSVLKESNSMTQTDFDKRVDMIKQFYMYGYVNSGFMVQPGMMIQPPQTQQMMNLMNPSFPFLNQLSTISQPPLPKIESQTENKK